MGVQKSIGKGLECFMQNVSFLVENGSSILLCYDSWSGTAPLKEEQFPDHFY